MCQCTPEIRTRISRQARLQVADGKRREGRRETMKLEPVAFVYWTGKAFAYKWETRPDPPQDLTRAMEWGLEQAERRRRAGLQT